MSSNEKKSINYYMRALHRDIGYFVIGLTIIYGLSGIILLYRDTEFLKQERQIERQLDANISEQDLGKALHLKGFEVEKTEGDVIYFKNGTYNKTTGKANYTDKTVPPIFEKFNQFHKTASSNLVHYFGVAYAVMLLFLAISSYWMYKPKSKMFRRGIILSALGIICAVVILFL